MYQGGFGEIKQKKKKKEKKKDWPQLLAQVPILKKKKQRNYLFGCYYMRRTHRASSHEFLKLVGSIKHERDKRKYVTRYTILN